MSAWEFVEVAGRVKRHAGVGVGVGNNECTFYDCSVQHSSTQCQPVHSAQPRISIHSHQGDTTY
jgi:hypothetical protein